MAYTKLLDLIVGRIFALKRIRGERKEIEELVESLLRHLMVFNELDEDETFVGCLNKPIDEIEIPTDFVDFILPNSVRYEQDNLLPDLLKRGSGCFMYTSAKWEKVIPRKTALKDGQEVEVKPEERIPLKADSYSKYKNDIYQLYNYMKKTPSFVKLDTLKKDVTLGDIIYRIPIRGRMIKKSNPVIPIYVEGISMEKLFGKHIAEVRVENMLESYVDDMFVD